MQSFFHSFAAFAVDAFFLSFIFRHHYQQLPKKSRLLSLYGLAMWASDGCRQTLFMGGKWCAQCTQKKKLKPQCCTTHKKEIVFTTESKKKDHFAKKIALKEQHRNNENLNNEWKNHTMYKRTIKKCFQKPHMPRKLLASMSAYEHIKSKGKYGCQIEINVTKRKRSKKTARKRSFECKKGVRWRKTTSCYEPKTCPIFAFENGNRR